MATPSKVRIKAELAERLIAERSNTLREDQAPAARKPELMAVTPTVTDANAPRQNPYAVNPTAIQRPAEPAQQDSDWKHKYSVLQGIFDKSRSENSDRINQLQNQINVLTTMASKPTTYQDTFHPDVPTQDPNYGLTEEQIEEIGGQDFVDAIGKISSAKAESQIATLRQELSAMQADQNESKEDTFYRRLGELSPNWKAINKDDRFKSWLNDSDGLSGIPRNNFLINAYDNRDAETSARYFNQFAELLPTDPSLNPDVMTDFVPNSTGGGGPLTNASGAIYTRATIQQFFKDRGLGKFKGREEEAAAIERDIFAAQKEGRIMLTGGRKSA